MELRSNWKAYCDEMIESIQAAKESDLAIDDNVIIEMKPILDSSPPMTSFERKFKLAGVELHSLQVKMASRTKDDRLRFLRLL